jgi:hypothetical protein
MLELLLFGRCNSSRGGSTAPAAWGHFASGRVGVE